jgi:hypothetical protein
MITPVLYVGALLGHWQVNQDSRIGTASGTCYRRHGYRYALHWQTVVTLARTSSSKDSTSSSLYFKNELERVTTLNLPVQPALAAGARASG